MSLLQLHILRPSSKHYTAENTPLKLQEWLENRLRVFRQLDLFASLAGGFGAAVLEVLNSIPQALKDLAIPHARIYGTAHASEKMAFLQTLHLMYVIRQGRDETVASVKRIIATYTRNFKSILKHLPQNFGKISWKALEIFLELCFSTVRAFRIVNILSLGFSAASGGATRALLLDNNGWGIADLGGSLVVLHRDKVKRSLR